MFKVTASTMGVSTPSTVAEDAGTGGYLYRGDPLRTPDHPDFQGYRGLRERPPGPLPQNVQAIAGKQARVAEYIRLRTEEHLTRKEAQDRMGVSRSASGYYEKELKARQQGDDAP